jgi:CheY-like chemotaxis protein
MTRRILVIDDEIDIREIARISLEMSRGWKVLTASTGKEGIALAAASQPAAILLDVNMPDMDGLTTLKQLLNETETRAIPVILLTAHVKATTNYAYLQSGAKAILIKPFDPVLLAEQIEKALDW